MSLVSKSASDLRADVEFPQRPLYAINSYRKDRNMTGDV